MNRYIEDKCIMTADWLPLFLYIFLERQGHDQHAFPTKP